MHYERTLWDFGCTLMWGLVEPQDAIVCTSPTAVRTLIVMIDHWKEQALALHGRKIEFPASIVEIPLATDLPAPGSDRAAARARLGFGAEDVAILVLGRLSSFDKMDLGESSLDNALEFDRIPPASHASADKASEKMITALRDRSQRRVTADPKFQEIQKDIERYLERKNRKTISLNEAVLKPERHQDKKEQDETDKDDPSSRGSDAPIFPVDAYNDEVLQISLDYEFLLRNPQAAQK